MRAPTLLFASTLFLAACPERALPCVSGATAACSCTDGRTGAQTCGAGGSFGACACAAPRLDVSQPTDATPADVAPYDAPPSRIAGLELASRLGGLWSGAATGTPLGDLPL